MVLDPVASTKTLARSFIRCVCFKCLSDVALTVAAFMFKASQITIFVKICWDPHGCVHGYVQTGARPARPARLPGPPACRPACPPACRPAGLLACPGTDPDGEGRWARQESGRGRDEIG